ncbi:MAG TPA: polysaccharide deacetylase family protein [Candidatus Sulfotelmatobacter sp.]|nr:polysaccharide deacetylase family protein [Candidatus Sulfotelmatobacter sp.]
MVSSFLFSKDIDMTRAWLAFILIGGLSSLATAQNAVPQVNVARWPQDRVAAVSLTFDDGIDSHLDHVGPILKKHHLNGTFFVATGLGPWEKRKAEWKQLADEGNELANHTVHHPCLLPEITPHSQDYTPEMMEAEIEDAARGIQQVTGSQRGMTFAYPCGNMSFGKPQDEVRNAALYARYIAENSFGARVYGANGSQGPEDINVLAINDLGFTADKDFPALLDMARPGIQAHNWGVYAFHGVGGDWLAITPETFDELAAYFERHPEVWTATFGDVLRYIEESKAAAPRVTQSDASSITLSMSWPLDKKIYDVPLTLKMQMPQGWKEASATADGKALNAKITDRTKGTVIVVDVPVGTGEVEITGRP